MNSIPIRRFFVTVVVTAILPAAVFADDAANLADRYFTYLDRNADSRVDADEFARIPVPMRDWLLKHGVKPDKPLLQKDFRQVFPKMLADLRRAVQTRTAAPTNGGTNSGGTEPSGPVETPLYSSSTEPEEAPSNVQKPSERLPGDFRDGDLNEDGQIDFFEWRKMRKDIAEFKNLDLNRDSVLSLAELEGNGGSSGSSSSSSAETPKIKVAPGVDLTKKSYDELTADQKKEYHAVVKVYFDYLDNTGNKDKKLQEKEWDASSRIKPIFVNAKIDIKKDMTESEFIAHYAKLVGTKDKSWQEKAKAASRSSRGNGGSRGRGGFGGNRGGFGRR